MPFLYLLSISFSRFGHVKTCWQKTIKNKIKSCININWITRFIQCDKMKRNNFCMKLTLHRKLTFQYLFSSPLEPGINYKTLLRKRLKAVNVKDYILATWNIRIHCSYKQCCILRKQYIENTFTNLEISLLICGLIFSNHSYDVFPKTAWMKIWILLFQ